MTLSRTVVVISHSINNCTTSLPPTPHLTPGT